MVPPKWQPKPHVCSTIFIHLSLFHFVPFFIPLFVFVPYFTSNQDSLVAIATRVRDGRQKNRGSSVLLNVNTGFGAIPIQWVPGNVYAGVKREGREVDHSPPFSAEVKNSGAVSSFPLTYSWRGA
jgi:hypothetical protein